MLELMNEAVCCVCPTNYAFILTSSKSEETGEYTGELEFNIKVQRTTVGRLMDVLLMLQDRDFKKFRTCVELPVTVTYQEECHEPAYELSARKFWVELDDGKVTVFIDGHSKAITIPKDHLDSQLRELHHKVRNGLSLQFSSSTLTATPLGSDDSRREFKVMVLDLCTINPKGQRKTLTLSHRGNLAVVAEHYREGKSIGKASTGVFPFPDYYEYSRNNRTPVKVFEKDVDGMWLPVEPAANTDIARLVTDSYEFKWI